jgi:hypothetical protein
MRQESIHLLTRMIQIKCKMKIRWQCKARTIWDNLWRGSIDPKKKNYVEEEEEMKIVDGVGATRDELLEDSL